MHHISHYKHLKIYHIQFLFEISITNQKQTKINLHIQILNFLKINIKQKVIKIQCFEMKIMKEILKIKKIIFIEEDQKIIQKEEHLYVNNAGKVIYLILHYILKINKNIILI